MARWDFSDGTKVENGRADGTSAFAALLRSCLLDADEGHPPPVHIAREPCGAMPLDVGSSWMLDFWLRHELERWNRVRGTTIKVDTDYKRTDADMPPAVRSFRVQVANGSAPPTTLPAPFTDRLLASDVD